MRSSLLFIILLVLNNRLNAQIVVKDYDSSYYYSLVMLLDKEIDDEERLRLFIVKEFDKGNLVGKNKDSIVVDEVTLLPQSDKKNFREVFQLAVGEYHVSVTKTGRQKKLKYIHARDLKAVMAEGKISDAFIDDFYLSPKKFNFNIELSNCIISGNAPTITPAGQTDFSGRLIFSNCAFLDQFLLSGCTFQQPVAIINCYGNFLGPEFLMIGNKFLKGLIILNEKLPGSEATEFIFKNFNIIQALQEDGSMGFCVNITYCDFKGPAYLVNSSKISRLVVNNCDFGNDIYMQQIENKDFFGSLFSIPQDYHFKFIRFFHDTLTLLSNYLIQDSRFSSVSLNKVKLSNFRVQLSSMSGDLEFMRSKADSTSDLNGMYFVGDESQKIYTDGTSFSLKDLRMWNQSMLNVRFVFSVPNNKDIYSKENRNIANDFFSKLQVEASEKLNSQQEAFLEFRDRLNYEKKQYELNYFLNNEQFLQLLWYGFLQLVVRNGYHGEINFFATVFIVVISFSLLYYFRHRNEVVRYLSRHWYTSVGKQKYPPRKDLRTYIRCLWISFWVFLNPKLPLQYFQIGNRLFPLFICQWLIGSFLLLLFLIFIASKYPFIKALFG